MPKLRDELKTIDTRPATLWSGVFVLPGDR